MMESLFVVACAQQFGGMDQLQRLEWMATAVRETYAAAREGLQTNYYGTKHVIEALLPLLQASSDGRIVNVSSEWGLLRVSIIGLFCQHLRLRSTRNSTSCILPTLSDKFFPV